MTQYDRIYVRFKGRVLGPLTHEKATELVRRGQITKQHELSPDGQAWRMAEEFSELFVPLNRGRTPETESSEPTPSDSLHPIAAEDQWYAHFDGSNQGPVDEGSLRQWIQQGKVRRETMVWKTGMDNWVEAHVIHDDWFVQQNRNPLATTLDSSTQTSSSESEHLRPIVEKLLEANGWTYFSAIVGIVIGVIWTIASIALFLYEVSRTTTSSMEMGGLLLSIHAIAWSIAFLFASTLLVQYSNSVGTLRYRATVHDVSRTLRRLAKFWSFSGICVLVWISITIFLLFLFYIMGLKILPQPSPWF